MSNYKLVDKSGTEQCLLDEMNPVRVEVD